MDLEKFFAHIFASSEPALPPPHIEGKDRDLTPTITEPPPTEFRRAECQLCQHMFPENNNMWSPSEQHCAALGKNLKVIVMGSVRGDPLQFSQSGMMWLQIAGPSKNHVRFKRPYPSCRDVAPTEQHCGHYKQQVEPR